MTVNDANTVKVGDRVLFKYDVEQYSDVYAIRGSGEDKEFQVEVTEGDYGHGMKWVSYRKCYKV